MTDRLITKFHFLKTVFKSRKRRLIALGTIVLLLGGLVYASFVLRGDAEASWWDGSSGGSSWLKRKRVPVVNNSTDSLAANTTVAITLNTKELVNQGKLQSDCDDLRVLYQPNDTTNTELDRFISYPGGGSCSTSEASKVYFKLQAALASSATSTDYYIYYGNDKATTPTNPDNAFDISAKDALLVCPFDGTTTCAASETPSTATGAIRYSGSKSALLFDGRGDNIDTGQTGTTFFGDATNKSFTIEGYVYLKKETATTYYQYLNVVSSSALTGNGGCSNFLPNLISFLHQDADTRELYFSLPHSYADGCQSATDLSFGSINYETWYHFAATYDHTTKIMKTYLNGSYVGQATWGGSSTITWSNNTDISSPTDAFDAHMILDEIRFSDVLRYTSNFTPSTTPYIRDEHTKLLYHFDENGTDPRVTSTTEVRDDSGNGYHGDLSGAVYVAGLVGVDKGTTDTGKDDGGNTYAGHEGIFIEEGTTNKVTNPSFEHATYNTNWTSQSNLNVRNISSAGTNTTDTNFHRKTWFDGTRYWSVYYDSGTTEFWYSTDGINWVQNTSASFAGEYASIVADSTNAFVIYESGNNIFARSATSYPGTNFSWSLPTTVFDTANNWYSPNITRDTSNYLWVIANEYNVGGDLDMHIYAKRSTNTNDITAWNAATEIGTGLNTIASNNSLVPLNLGDIYAIFYEGTGAYGCFYDAQTSVRWEDSAGADCTNGTNQDSIYATGTGYQASATSDTTNNDVHFIIGDSDGAKYIRWDNGTGTNGVWQSSVDLGNQAVDPTISIDSSTDDLYAFWYDWTTDTIKYRWCDDSAATSECSALGDWASEINIQTGQTADNGAELSSNFRDSGKIFLTWSDGTATNYTIKWTQVLGPTMTPTENTSAPYYKFGSKSVKLVPSGDGSFIASINPGNTNTHTLFAYAYDGTSSSIGGAIDATDASLIFGSSLQTTTYTDMGGGWWRLSYSGTPPSGTASYGIQVKSGKTIYVDGVQLEEKDYTTTYADGSLTSNAGGNDTYFWDDDCDGTLDAGEDETADQNAQCSSRVKSQLEYLSTSNISANSGTVSFWAKIPYAYAASGNMIFNWGLSANDRIQIYSYGTTASSFFRMTFATNGGTTRSCGTVTQNANINEWHHITFTYTTNSGGSDSCQVYYDGGYATTGSSGQTWTFAPSGNIGIGVIPQTGAVTMAENVSDLRIFNSTLTSTEVADLYYAGLVSHSDNAEVDAFSSNKSQDPVGVYHFDESYGTTANDSSVYDNDLTVYGATWETQSVGARARLTRNLKFDGTNDIASASAQIAREYNFGTESFSISGWFRHSSTIAGTDTIVAKYGSAGYKVYMNSSGNVCGGIDDDSTFDEDIVCSTATQGSLADSKWHHFEIVKNGTTSLTTYIDAVQVNQDTTIAATGTLNSNSGIFIGSDSNNSNYWDGYLDEIVFYPYARDATQVKEDYLGSQVAQLYGAQAFDPFTQGLVGYWKMDETSWTNNCAADAALDSSGNNNHGHSCPNGTGPTAPTTGKFGNAVSFDGGSTDDDYFDAGSGTSLDNLWDGGGTFSAWVYLNSNTITNFIGKSARWLISYNTSGQLGLLFQFTSNNGNWTSPNSSVSTGSWVHVAVTYNPDSVNNDPQFYINGTQSTITESSTPLGTRGDDSSGSVGIGVLQPPDGKMDDVRLYDRILSPAEVAALYNWAPGPVGYWKLDEGNGTTAYDSSGNGNVSTSFGASWSPGKFGSGISTDGTVSSRVNFNETTSTDLGGTNDSYTVSAWVKTNSSGLVVGKLDNDDTTYPFLLELSSGNAHWQFREGANITSSSGITSLSNNQWHYLTGVRNVATDTSYLYVDGVLVDSDNDVSTASLANDRQLTLGATIDDKARLPGSIDDVRIYKYARTQAQIVEDMNAGHSAPGSPVGSALLQYNLDEGYGDTGNNTGNGGSVNVNLAGASSCPGVAACPTWTNDGKLGKALSFDGTDDYAQTSSTVDLGSTTKLTVAFWLYWNSYANDDKLAMESSTNYNNNYGTILINPNSSGSSNGRFAFSVQRSSIGSAYRTESITRPSAAAWHHYIAVFNYGTNGNADADIRIYVDGTEQATTIDNNDISNTSNFANYTWYFMSRAGTSLFGAGKMDDVRIFTSELTADQVKVLYNQTSSAVWGATSTDSTGVATWSSTNEYCPPGQGSTCTPPVAEWKFDENTGTVANDTSGNANTGTLTNGPLWKTGKFGSSVFFDGGSGGTPDDVIDAGSGTSIDNIFDGGGTVSLWVKPQSSGEANTGKLFQKESPGAGTNGGYNAHTETCDSTRVDLELNAGTNTAGSQWNANCVLTLNQWTHVAIVYNDDAQANDPTFYINGILTAINEDTNPTADYPSSQEAGVNLNIGSNTAQTFDGTIDNVLFYNYERTPAQIAWEYSQGAPVAYWKFDECTGTTAYDSSGNSLNGTISPGSTGGTNDAVGSCSSGDTTEMWNNGTTGKRNASLDFDGDTSPSTDTDYVEVADNDKLDFGLDESFSVEAWINRDTTGGFDTIVAKDNDVSAITDAGYTLVLRPQNNAAFYVGYGAGNVGTTLSTTNITSTGWYHIVGVLNQADDTIKIYVNGKQEDSQSLFAGQGPSNALALRIGSESDGGEPFDGKIDNVRIYRYPLTAQQVKDKYNEGAVYFGP